MKRYGRFASRIYSNGLVKILICVLSFFEYSTGDRITKNRLKHLCFGKDLVNFSEIRFANSRQRMYINIRHDLHCHMFTRQISAVDQQAWDGKLTEKVREANQLLEKLLNVQFLLILAGCAEEYAQSGR